MARRRRNLFEFLYVKLDLQTDCLLEIEVRQNIKNRDKEAQKEGK